MRRRCEPVPLGLQYSTTGPHGPVGRDMINGIMLRIDEVNLDPDNEFACAAKSFRPSSS